MVNSQNALTRTLLYPEQLVPVEGDVPHVPTDGRAKQTVPVEIHEQRELVHREAVVEPGFRHVVVLRWKRDAQEGFVANQVE